MTHRELTLNWNVPIVHRIDHKAGSTTIMGCLVREC